MDDEIRKAAEGYLTRERKALRIPVPVENVLEEDTKDRTCPENKGVVACPRYKLMVTAEICAQCKTSPEFKQSLFASYVRNRAARETPCWRRGPQIGQVKTTCCGGKKEVTFSVHICQRTDKRVSDPDCWVCSDYDPQGGY